MVGGNLGGMEKTTLYLSSQTQRELRAEARRSGRPQAALVRDALVEYLARRPRALPRSIAIASDGKVNARSAKEAVRREWDRKWMAGARRRG